MSVGKTRAAIVQAEMNESMANAVFGEMFILCVAAGFYFSSWIVAVGVGFGLIALLQIKALTAIVLGLLSLFWGFAAYVIAVYFEWSTGETTAGVLVAVAVTGGAHVGFFEWKQDMEAE